MRKEKRQRLIKQAVREHEIDTQEKLVELLAKKRGNCNTSYYLAR